MSRKIMRVSLDFNWPLEQTWEGYEWQPGWTEANNGAYDPPAGDGWQLWETTTEGSPISPVFPTAEDLATWMASPDRGSDQISVSAAARVIAEGGALTAVAIEGHGAARGFQDGQLWEADR